MNLFDAIIIGSEGSSKTLAIELATRQCTVAIVECCERVNAYIDFCNPALCDFINSAKVSNTQNKDNKEKQEIFYKTAIKEKDELIASLYDKYHFDIEQYPQITLLKGSTQFLSPHTIKVIDDLEEEIELNAKEFIINTSSNYIIPMIDGIDKSKYTYTPNTLFHYENLPQNLIVISQSKEGLEFASLYANFGSKVTLIISNSNFMTNFDKDLSGSIKEVLENKNIKIKLNFKSLSIEDKAEEACLTILNNATNDVEYLYGDAILAIEGESPIARHLNLKNIGLDLNESGLVITNNHLHTILPNIWAMGRAVNLSVTTSSTENDCNVILNNMFGNQLNTIEEYNPIVKHIHIDPPLSYIGITENEALNKGYAIKIFRSIIKNEKDKTMGFTKIIVNSDTNRIIGCFLFCNDSYSLITILEKYMKEGKTYNEILSQQDINKTICNMFKQ